MAQYNEVEFFGQKLLSVRGDTVTPETLLAGRTAHDASGTPITGEFAVNPLTAEENGTFTPPAGSAYGPVTVNVPQTDAEPLSVTENGTYNAPAGKAYTPVTVAVPQTDTQPLTVTENGTYTAPQGAAYTPVTVNVPGTDTDDATAQAADIVAGQTAYARGDKLTGTMPNLDAIAFGEGATPPERGYTAGARYQAIAEAIEDLEANAVNVTPLTVTENGTYQAEGVAYSPVEVNVNAAPETVTINVTLTGTPGTDDTITVFYSSAQHDDIFGRGYPIESPNMVFAGNVQTRELTLNVMKGGVLGIRAIFRASITLTPTPTFQYTHFGNSSYSGGGASVYWVFDTVYTSGNLTIALS